MPSNLNREISFHPELFKDRTAVIIGASSGIGKQIAEDFSSFGGSSILISRDIKKLKGIVKNIRKSCFIKGDISTSKGCDQIYESLSKKYKAIDCFVLSAGCFHSRPIEKTTEKIWNDTIDCNLKGHFFAVKKLLPLIKKGKNKSIVIISSILGTFGAANVSAYSASKGGLILLVKSLSVELASEDIRINCVSPSYVSTPMIAGIISDSQIRKSIIQAHPLERIGKPQDVSSLVLYLLSDMSSWMTGNNIIIDGGRSACV